MKQKITMQEVYNTGGYSLLISDVYLIENKQLFAIYKQGNPPKGGITTQALTTVRDSVEVDLPNHNKNLPVAFIPIENKASALSQHAEKDIELLSIRHVSYFHRPKRSPITLDNSPPFMSLPEIASPSNRFFPITKITPAEKKRNFEAELKEAQEAVRIAEKKYEAVDPTNYHVAKELERKWEKALANLEKLNKEHQEHLLSKPVFRALGRN